MKAELLLMLLTFLLAGCAAHASEQKRVRAPDHDRRSLCYEPGICPSYGDVASAKNEKDLRR